MAVRKTTILYSVANDAIGNILHARIAEKNLDFFCPVCKGVMVLRKSGKTGKNTKRPHFAHKSLTPNCTPETALHFSFKILAFNYIRRLIENKELETPD